MDLDEAKALLARRDEFIGREVLETDVHWGESPAQRCTDVVLRDTWFALVAGDQEFGGEIEFLAWDDTRNRLSSAFGMVWQLQGRRDDENS